MGYDADGARARPRNGRRRHPYLGRYVFDDPALIALEDLNLNIFVDLCSSVQAPDPTASRMLRRTSASTRPRSTCSLSCATWSFVGTRSSLRRFSPSFAGRSRTMGWTTCERSPELQEALFRICKGNKRIDDQVAPVLSLLQSRLDNVGMLREVTGDGFRELLARMIMETQDRFPAIHDLARELQYHYFERPVQEQVTKVTLAKVDNDPLGARRGSTRARPSRSNRRARRGPAPAQGVSIEAARAARATRSA